MTALRCGPSENLKNVAALLEGLYSVIEHHNEMVTVSASDRAKFSDYKIMDLINPI